MKPLEYLESVRSKQRARYAAQVSAAPAKAATLPVAEKSKSDVLKFAAEPRGVTRAELDAHVVAILSIAESTKSTIARPFDLLDKVAAEPTAYGLSTATAQAIQRLRKRLDVVDTKVGETDRRLRSARASAYQEAAGKRPPRWC